MALPTTPGASAAIAVTLRQGLNALRIERAVGASFSISAFSFTLVACAYYPFLLAPLAAFTALVALSRMILGLHYPTDVAAGVAIGLLLGAVSVGI